MLRKLFTSFFLFAILFARLPAAAENRDTDTHRRIDSIAGLLPALEGPERAGAYRAMDSLYSLTDRFDEHLACLEDEIRYARRQKDLNAEGKARIDIFATYFNRHEAWEQYLKRIDGDMNFWRDNKQWDNYYYAFYMAMRKLIHGNQAQAAIEKATAEYNDAKARNNSPGKGVASAAMGVAYHSQDRYDEAVQCLEEAVDRLRKEPFGEYGSLLMEVYDELVQSLFNNGDNDGSVRVLTEWGNLLEANRTLVHNAHWCNWYVTCGMAYTLLERLSEAEDMLNKADAIAVGMGDNAVKMVKGACVPLYYAQKRYNEAMSLTDSLLNHFRWLTGEQIIMQKYKLAIADSIGNAALAVEIRKELYHLNDSINTIEIAAKLDELRTLYEVDRHVMEKQRNRNYFTFAAIACILILSG
ncbi:MAG: hypothetical protein LBD21_10155 [Tannerellaceae bacterium]|nr:hypothetical protein [Tannerellaceae bacterium]